MTAQFTHLEELGLKTGESTSNTQIQFLPGIHRPRLIFIRLHQGVHSSLYIPVCDGGELSTKDDLKKSKKKLSEFIYVIIP